MKTSPGGAQNITSIVTVTACVQQNVSLSAEQTMSPPVSTSLLTNTEANHSVSSATSVTAANSATQATSATSATSGKTDLS